MANILALETATDACSAALLSNGETTMRFEIAPRRHTDLILPMISALLADAQLAVQNLDAVAFGAGPGSFTGVRIATAVTQGLALAHDIPVIPLSVLEILAIGGAREHDSTTVVPMMDARRAEIYWAVYAIDHITHLARNISPDAVGRPSDFILPDSSPCVVVGSGGQVYRKEILATGVALAALKNQPLYPSAIDALYPALHGLNSDAAISAEFAAPIYLRAAV